MKFKCKKCGEEWSGSIPWMLLFVCPKCGSHNTEELTQSVWSDQPVKIVEPGSVIDTWVKKYKPLIKKDES